MRFALASGVLIAAAMAWTCGIPDLNDEKKDAGTCRTKVDCSGCLTCQELCTCVSATGIASCVASCEVDGGLGGSGASGGTSGDSSVSGGGTISTGGAGGSIQGGSGGIGAGGGAAGAVSSGGTVSTGGSAGTAPGGTTGNGGTGGCTASLEGAFQTCTDGCDNDGDGYIDCADSNCAQDAACTKHVYCGTGACNLASAYCCYGNTNTACKPKGEACNGTPIACDGPADCSDGKICCGFMISEPNYHYESIGCVNPINCSYPNGGRIFCGGDAAVCPDEQPCGPSGLVSGYYVCDSI